MTISDEELDELKRLTKRLRGVTGVIYVAEGVRFDDIFDRLLSHYRSARNDGIEDAAEIVDRALALSPSAVTKAEFEIKDTVSLMFAAVADQIRSLKSPPAVRTRNRR